MQVHTETFKVVVTKTLVLEYLLAFLFEFNQENFTQLGRLPWVFYDCVFAMIIFIVIYSSYYSITSLSVWKKIGIVETWNRVKVVDKICESSIVGTYIERTQNVQKTSWTCARPLLSTFNFRPVSKTSIERQCWSNSQYSRREYLEISGIPDKIDHKDLEDTALNIFRKLDVEIDSSNIEDSHWLLSKGPKQVLQDALAKIQKIVD